MNTAIQNPSVPPSSVPSVSPPSPPPPPPPPPPPLPPRSTRGLSRLAGLSERQLQHINTWLDDSVPYRQIADLCRTEFQVEIPHMTIARYNKRSAARKLLDDLPDSREAAAEISLYAATGDAHFSTNTLEILEQKAFDLALAYDRDAEPDDLKTLNDLHKIITRARNTALRERHAAIQETKNNLRHEDLALKRDMNEFKKQLATEKLALARQSLAFRQKQYDDRAAAKQTQSPPAANHSHHGSPLTPNPSRVFQGPCPLPPETMARNRLYAMKVEAGEIRHRGGYGNEVSYTEYCNPADKPSFARDATARFVPEDRPFFLPPLDPVFENTPIQTQSCQPKPSGDPGESD